MTAFIIPLTAAAPQKFTISLSGVAYTFTLTWNDPGQVWILNIADVNGNAILSGVPLITGVDLLEQFGYLGFSGQLQVQTNNDTFAVPTFENLGVGGNLYYLTTP